MAATRCRDVAQELEERGPRVDRGGGSLGDQLEALDRGARLAGAEHALYRDFVFSVGLGALFW